MERISVVINTYNAERYLREVLSSAQAFDEIVVCDMESTDSTTEIANEFGCKVVLFPKGDVSICEPARNTAIQSASNPWVLLVDADELVPQALRDYLYSHIKGNPDASALDICRQNRFMGKPATEGCDRQLRFFRKDRVYWPPTIHSRPVIEGSVEKMPADKKDMYLIHLDNPTIAERVRKLDNYSTQEVEKRINRSFGCGSLLFRPIWAFIRTLILRRGCRDGRRGIVRAQLNAFYQLLVMAKVIEKQIEHGVNEPQFPEARPERILHMGRNRVWIDYIDGEKVVIKQFSQGLFRSFLNLFRRDKAVLSKRNAEELIRRGFSTPEPVAAIIQRRRIGTVKHSYYISRFDSESVSLAEAIDSYGEVAIEAFAEFVSKLHQAGILHKDLNNTNVRVRDNKGVLSFGLIDLNRMKFCSQGTPVGIKESFDNITRFCCFDDTFYKFIDYYFDARGLDRALRSDALRAKGCHDAAFDRKKEFKKILRIR